MEEIKTKKICTKCKIEKDISEFYLINKKLKDGTYDKVLSSKLSL